MESTAIVVMVTCLCLSVRYRPVPVVISHSTITLSLNREILRLLLYSTTTPTQIRIKITLDKPLYHAWEPITFTVVSDRDRYRPVHVTKVPLAGLSLSGLTKQSRWSGKCSATILYQSRIQWTVQICVGRVCSVWNGYLPLHALKRIKNLSNRIS